MIQGPETQFEEQVHKYGTITLSPTVTADPILRMRPGYHNADDSDEALKWAQLFLVWLLAQLGARTRVATLSYADRSDNSFTPSSEDIVKHCASKRHANQLII